VASFPSMSRDRPPNATGTYGFLGVLRHPSRMVHAPEASEGVPDIEALRRGEARSVSCFLRGTYGPFPRTLRQGRLDLTGGTARWIPFWSIRRDPLALDFSVQDVTTRPADSSEPLVKKGRSLIVVKEPVFVVVTCTVSSGALDLVIPSADEPLVATFFREKVR